MVIKLPGRTLASAGMKSPPELASKIVTPRTSPLPKRISLGRRRSGNSPTSLGNALPKTLATLGVIRTKAYGIFLGSCCPAHTSQLSGPLTGITAQPPTARWDSRSVILKRMPTPRTVALPPRNLGINASNYVRSTRLLFGILWKWRLLGRVLLARHTDGPGDDVRATPLHYREYPNQALEAHSPREGEPIM